MSSEQAKVEKLLESVMQNAEKDRLQEAAKNLQEARKIAGKAKNPELKKTGAGAGHGDFR